LLPGCTRAIPEVPQQRSSCVPGYMGRQLHRFRPKGVLSKTTLITEHQEHDHGWDLLCVDQRNGNHISRAHLRALLDRALGVQLRRRRLRPRDVCPRTCGRGAVWRGLCSPGVRRDLPRMHQRVSCLLSGGSRDVHGTPMFQ
jgi:hypothetical protein